MAGSDQELRQHGLKVTAPRMKILHVLEATQSHLSAEAIYQRLSSASASEVSLATVYRVLTQFEQAGIIKRHNFEGDHSVFELDQGEHHDHMVCVQCGIVVEFVDQAIERKQLDIADSHGFTITDHTLTIYGRCPTCQ